MWWGEVMPAVSLQDKGEGSIAERQHGLILYNENMVREEAIITDSYEEGLVEFEPESLMSLAYGSNPFSYKAHSYLESLHSVTEA